MHRPIAARWLGILGIPAALAAGGCASPDSDSRFQRHFAGEYWSQGLVEMTEQPYQAIPEFVTLAAVPFALALEDPSTDQASGSSETGGDVTILALEVGSLAWGACEWIGGDQGWSFETAAEATIATALATNALKGLIYRDRPDGGNDSSFPSGHTSLSFCGATFLARRIEDLYGTEWGYLLYLPAAYVAYDRVEANRHFASDVFFGAFLGIFLTNWIYNAHYGSENPPRGGILDPRVEPRFSLGPITTDAGVGLGLQLSF